MGWLLLLVTLAYGPEPYGGCDKAYLYPATEGHLWCALHGRL